MKARIIKKPWGEEQWLAHTDKYAGKIFTIKKGHRLSLQYHKEKHETLYLDKGKAKVILEDENGNLCEYVLAPGDIMEVLAGRRHRTEALEECRIIEFSTPELDDVVRIEDDYER